MRSARFASRPARRTAGGGIRLAVRHGAGSAAGFGVFFVFVGAASEAGLPWALPVSRLRAVVAIVGVALARRCRCRVARCRDARCRVARCRVAR